MPSDPISGLSGILHALRRRLAERSERTAARGSSTAASTAGGRAFTKGDIGELRRRIVARLGALAPEDRAAPRAARIFVESTLAWEFGEDIVSDPSFAKLAADVQEAITESPEVRARFLELLKKI